MEESQSQREVRHPEDSREKCIMLVLKMGGGATNQGELEKARERALPEHPGALRLVRDTGPDL